MPTGYTAGVGDGKVTDFATFAMECARAFGALVELRDDMTAPIPDTFTASSYHAEALAKARKEYAEFRALDEAESQRRADAEFSYAMDAWQTAKRAREEKRVRYQTMLEEVKAWTPPTKDHQGLKEFMVQQLTESIKFDCNHDDERWVPKRLTVDQWRIDRAKRLLRDIEYHQQHGFDDRKRAAERTAWVRDLRDSFANKRVRATR